MTLTTHATVGAATALLFPQYPGAAFAAAFASHFMIDAIPHWDYQLKSFEKDERNPLSKRVVLGRHTLLDLLKLGSDCLLSLIIPMMLFYSWPAFSPLIVLLGIVGGVLPDALQFAYFKLKWRPLERLQAFHYWIHTDKRLSGQPVLGVTLQLILVFLVIKII